MDSEALIIEIENRLRCRTIGEMCQFLSLLTYCLTETVRWFVSQEPASDVLLPKMKAINEIQHRIGSRLMRVLNGTDEWTERDFILTLMSLAKGGGCAPEVKRALEETVSKLLFGNDPLSGAEPPVVTE